MPADFLKENLEFLDRQKLMEPSLNGQVGFVLFLRVLGLEARARELYEQTVKLLGLYGSGRPMDD